MTALTRATPSWRALLMTGVLAAASALLLLAVIASRSSSPPSFPPARTAQRPGLSSLPAAALGPVSATLGASDPAYGMSASGAAWSAANPAQGLRARFTRAGVAIAAGAMTVGLRLSGIGYGEDLAGVGEVRPRASANRVDYLRTGLDEWYANGPAGIEQGFTIEHPPARAAGPLTLAMALSGNAHASLSPGAQSIALTHTGGSSLRYGELAVTDASGRSLRSWLALHGRTVIVSVETRGARYPLRIDPLVQQGGKLTPNDEAGGASEAGTSVAISANGNTALIGGIGDEGGKKVSMAGAAWVFSRSGSEWKQQAKLVGGGEEGEAQFGISVALSSDGNTALIGGINDETGKKPFGAAWVFTRSGSAWSQQGSKLTVGEPEETEDGRFGKSVALSADGNTALIGAYFDAGFDGAAWVFTRSGSEWTQQGGKLTGGGEVGEAEFGLSAALSADGNTALIGGPDDGKVAMTGAAWVFTRSGSTWTQQEELTGTNEVGASELGTSVALSADGNTALAGGPGDGSAGAAWAFARSGSSWTQQGEKLTPSDASGAAAFGAGVALSADGDTALIGGPTDMGKVPTGAAWEFARSGSTWSQQGTKLRGSDVVPESEFGAAVALSSDGDTALIGGPIDNANIGAAWAFVDPPPTVITDAATNLNISTATLNGTVDAGASSTVSFQYGTTTAYGASTPPQDNSALSSPEPIAAAVTGLVPGTTYHFRIVAENSAGVSVGADQVFTTPVPPVIHASLAPVISAASQTHRKWREGRKLASVSRRLPPIGTAFHFTVNERATVRFAFTQRVGGRRVGGRCVAQTKGNRHKRPCKRTVTRGTLSFGGRESKNKVSFQGRLSHSKKLKPGSYTLLITALNSAHQHSNTKSLSFTIVK